mgnify:CR=1 FL=1
MLLTLHKIKLRLCLTTRLSSYTVNFATMLISSDFPLCHEMERGLGVRT